MTKSDYRNWLATLTDEQLLIEAVARYGIYRRSRRDRDTEWFAFEVAYHLRDRGKLSIWVEAVHRARADPQGIGK